MSFFKKTILDNGIRVVSETHHHTKAVSIGVWISTGTRNEPENAAGISHFLEHLVFKGTQKRSSFQIAKALEEVGGELNAYTTREYTCYHALILKDYWVRGLDVLADITTGMKLKKSDFELEKSVVLQEIAASEENHEDHIYDEYLKRIYKNSTLGLPILGTEKSISSMSLKQVYEYYRTHYIGSNIIVSCAGDIDHEELVKKVSYYFPKKFNSKNITSNFSADQFRTQKKSKGQKTVEYFPFVDMIQKPSDQIHLLTGLPAASFRDEMRFEAFIVNALLGGGMTSRLFQSIREKKGLAYTIYSSLNTFTDAGFISVYSAVEKKNLEKLIKAIHFEFFKVREKKISTSELKLFKTQVTGSILLGSDDVENRMTSLGVNEMAFREYKPVENVIQEIESVSLKSIANYIEKYFSNPKLALLLLGTVK